MTVQTHETETQKTKNYSIVATCCFALLSLVTLLVSNYLSVTPVDVSPTQPILGEPFVAHFDDLHGGDAMPPVLHAELMHHVNESVAQLQAQHILPATFTAPPVQFSQPIRATSDTSGFSYYAISNYFDHDPLFVDQLQDYRCGDHTYDAEDGYNHSGTDFMPFPFPWQKMDRDEVQVIAAASGIIIEKEDGHFDSECVALANQGNTIVLQHEDGTKSWYLHMKNGSLLSKSIGEEVTVGEYLGVIGSSGRSNGPHLHFELTDANGDLIDPFFDASTATCNTTTSETRWANQLSYAESGINDIVLSAEAPQFPSCAKAILSERTTFAPEGQVIFNVFYRNDSITKQTDFVLYEPNGEPVVNWTHAPTETHSAGAAWSFPLVLPANVPLGEWMLKATYEERDYEKGFVVAASVAATPLPTATYTPVPTAAPATATPVPTTVPATATATSTPLPTATPVSTATPVPTATSPSTTIDQPVATPSTNNMIYLPAVTN